MPVTIRMEKFKVKYTRKEYREEYLQSEHWISLRDQIMSTSPDCQCCGKPAYDLHHLVYRNIVDVTIKDLLPVCRACHEYIHEAITDDWISQNPTKLKEITEKTLNILHDEEYKEYHKWLNTKHFLPIEEQELIKSLQAFVIKKISGILKRKIWYDNLAELKFTGHQINKIRKVVDLSIKRRIDKKDKVPSSILGRAKHTITGKMIKGMKKKK